MNRSNVLHSVSELNQMVACLLTDCFPTLKVIGEVSNFSVPRSGHWYFSLKDDKAQVRCVFFNGKQRMENVVIHDGKRVVVYANLRLYETRGEFQLNVEAVELAGEGFLYQQFEVLKKQLEREGLFSTTHKKPLPAFIKTVGIITSATGAAIQDILSVLKRRFPAICIIIYPTLVQGEYAAKEIAMQIAMANARQECDVLIVSRGGGSLEDLWPFNEIVVARAIYASNIPLISAVGHETDHTISDFVADIRAATPSAAAELVSPDQIKWQQLLLQLKERLYIAMQSLLQHYMQKVAYLQRGLCHPGQQLENYAQHFDELERRLQQTWQYRFEKKQDQLTYLTRALESFNPLRTLARGYCVVKKKSDGETIYATHQVHRGETIIAQLSQGRLLCTVTKKEGNGAKRI